MLCYYACIESSGVAVSYVNVSGTGDHSPPVSLQDGNVTPTTPNAGGGDPGLTVLQSPVSQAQVASSIPPYSTMLPSFGHYATGKIVDFFCVYMLAPSEVLKLELKFFCNIKKNNFLP